MDYQEQDYEYGPEDSNVKNNAMTGLKIAIVILLVVLAAVSVLYYQSVQQAKEEEAVLRVDLDTLERQTERLIGDMGNLKFDNDTLNRNLQNERYKADSLVKRLKQERSLSYKKLKDYQSELGTLRSSMQGMVRQIDSLSRLNQKLVGENLEYRNKITTLMTETEAAKETASELNSKVNRAAVIRARNITIAPLNKSGKVIDRVKNAVQIRISFVLVANELAKAGPRPIYVRVVSPDGYDLTENASATFELEGKRTLYTAMRDDVDYRGDEDLPVNVFFSQKGFALGRYKVFIYMDGHMVGDADIDLKK